MDVSTTNPVQLNTTYASFGRRFLAYFVDFLITFFITVIIHQVFGSDPLAMLKVDTLSQMQEIQQSRAYSLSTSFGLVAIISFYTILWVNFDGATPGKKLMAIKIVRVDGSPLTYGVAFIRYIGYMISSILLLGFLWVIWDKKKQGWHDKMSDTVVVNTDDTPRTFIAIIVTLISIVIMVTTMMQGVLLGINQITSGLDVLQSRIPNDSIAVSMSPAAKTHYDKAQVVLLRINVQMAADPTNSEAVIPLANDAIKSFQADNKNGMFDKDILAAQK